MKSQHTIVSRDEWNDARRELLAPEKEFTRMSDELGRARRDLPWVRVDSKYEFETDAGTKSLSELFGDASQLVVYHFMFAPDRAVGCTSCSLWANHFDGITAHLAQRDVGFVAVSRAPLSKLASFERRRGWRFEWASSYASDFDFDFHVSFRPEDPRDGRATYDYEPARGAFEEREGLSVFFKDERGTIFPTYSSYARGIEMVHAAYQWIDLVPKGRDAAGLSYPIEWLRFRDEYAR